MINRHITENRSDYEALYQMHNGRQTVLADPVTGKLLLQKELEYYNIEVFRYLKEHPSDYIPSVVDYEVKDGHLFVKEEFVEGQTLDDLLEEDFLSAEQKKDIVLQIMDGLSFLHHASPSIIHRDLKASNILVQDNGKVKIIDYDAAKIYKPDEAKDTVLIGTEGSAAPEQYGFGSSDQRTDIYALGILLTRLFPEDQRILGVAAKASKLDPADRYQTVEEMKKDFLRNKVPGSELAFTKYLPPGFRTLQPWKMLIAFLGYSMIFYVSFTLKITDHTSGAEVTGADLVKYKIIVFLIFMTELDLLTGWTPLFDHFPFLHSKNLFIRIFAYGVTGFLIAVAYVIILGILLAF